MPKFSVPGLSYKNSKLFSSLRTCTRCYPAPGSLHNRFMSRAVLEHVKSADSLGCFLPAAAFFHKVVAYQFLGLSVFW